MQRKYINKMIESGKWIPDTLPNGLKIYWSKRSSNFIDEFSSKGDNFCPHFKVLGVASGSCATLCKGCFLLGTFRVMRDPGVPLLYNNLDKCIKDLEKSMFESEQPNVYSDGEKCDSLLYDEYHGITKYLLPVFRKNKNLGHKWLRLTKSANVKHLIELEHENTMILSYSLNSQEVANLFETNPQATIREKIKAAALAQNIGSYPSRVRIDPIIPAGNWKKLYKDFLIEMKEFNFIPDRFTLGTYRVLKGSKSMDKILDSEFVIPIAELEDINECKKKRRLRIPIEKRIDIYSFIIEEIKRLFPYSEIGLCKETKALRDSLGFTDDDKICNCTL